MIPAFPVWRVRRSHEVVNVAVWTRGAVAVSNVPRRRWQWLERGRSLTHPEEITQPPHHVLILRLRAARVNFSDGGSYLFQSFHTQYGRQTSATAPPTSSSRNAANHGHGHGTCTRGG